MPIDEVIATCKAGAALGCQEALFTLGEKPELRYRAARESLAALGFKTTIDYVIEVARRVLVETGLLPHINAGNLTRDEMLALRDVSASMGIMLESASSRLCEKGMPHYGSPLNRFLLDASPTVPHLFLHSSGDKLITPAHVGEFQDSMRKRGASIEHRMWGEEVSHCAAMMKHPKEYTSIVANFVGELDEE